MALGTLKAFSQRRTSAPHQPVPLHLSKSSASSRAMRSVAGRASTRRPATPACLQIGLRGDAARARVRRPDAAHFYRNVDRYQPRRLITNLPKSGGLSTRSTRCRLSRRVGPYTIPRCQCGSSHSGPDHPVALTGLRTRSRAACPKPSGCRAQKLWAPWLVRAEVARGGAARRAWLVAIRETGSRGAHVVTYASIAAAASCTASRRLEGYVFSASARDVGIPPIATGPSAAVTGPIGRRRAGAPRRGA